MNYLSLTNNSIVRKGGGVHCGIKIEAEYKELVQQLI